MMFNLTHVGFEHKVLFTSMASQNEIQVDMFNSSFRQVAKAWSKIK